MSRESPTVYLAGPIKGTSYDSCVNWRKTTVDVFESAGIKAFSPMRYKKYLVGEAMVGDSYDYPLCTAEGITSRDRYDCTHCDLVLVNVLGAQFASIGTCMEIAWADLARIPIVLAIEPGNIHDHGMINTCVGFRVPTLDEAIEVATAILLP